MRVCGAVQVRRDDGDAYADYMSATGIPGYSNTPGNLGAVMLRREANGLCEFIMFSLWESMSSIEAFAGDQPEKAIFIRKMIAFSCNAI